MEKLQTLLWILFGLGVFVFRMVKQMRETAAKEAQERPNKPVGEGQALPPATFQDLLREIQARNANSDAPQPTPPATPKPAGKAKKAGKRTPGNPVPQGQSRAARSQERTDIKSISLERRSSPAINASNLPRASAEAPIEDYWQQRTRERAEDATHQPIPLTQVVRQQLARPESVRAALVLSEILQRRHF